jgi:hypothetical protein
MLSEGSDSLGLQEVMAPEKGPKIPAGSRDPGCGEKALTERLTEWGWSAARIPREGERVGAVRRRSPVSRNHTRRVHPSGNREANSALKAREHEIRRLAPLMEPREP